MTSATVRRRWSLLLDPMVPGYALPLTARQRIPSSSKGKDGRPSSIILPATLKRSDEPDLLDKPSSGGNPCRLQSQSAVGPVPSKPYRVWGSRFFHFQKK